MKKIIIPLILGLLIVIVLLLTYNFEEQSDIKQAMSLLNIDDIELADSVSIIGQKLFTVLVFYSYNCELCNYEAEQLKKSKMNGNYEFVWVSSNNIEVAENFFKRNGLDSFEYNKLGRISNDLIISKYGIDGTPSMLIYKNKKLIKKHKGLIEISELKKIINNIEDAGH